MQINDFLSRSEFKRVRHALSQKDNKTSLEEFLSQPYYEEANKLLTREMGMNAGYNLLTKMKDVLGEKEKAMSWFYTPSIALGNKRPYDYCKENKRQLVYDELIRIEHGLLA